MIQEKEGAFHCLILHHQHFPGLLRRPSGVWQCLVLAFANSPPQKLGGPEWAIYRPASNSSNFGAAHYKTAEDVLVDAKVHASSTIK